VYEASAPAVHRSGVTVVDAADPADASSGVDCAGYEYCRFDVNLTGVGITSLTVQVLSGLAALAGHNWSPFLRLTGGRGVGPAIGFMLVFSWPGLGAFIGASLVGVAL